MKKILCIILSLALALGMLTFPATAADTATAVDAPAIPTEGDVWDGSITQPTKLVNKDGVTYYEITKCAELAYVAQTGGDWLGYNYILGNNLILNKVVFTWDEDGNLTNSETEIAALHEWTPIEDYYGYFDGNGYAISGVYCVTDIRQSLFGWCSGSINNTHVVNSFYKRTSDCRTGGIVAFLSSGEVNNCSFSGLINGLAGGNFIPNSAGGIVGQASTSSISNCYNYGTVLGCSYSFDHHAPGQDNHTGGIVGEVSNGTVTNCTNYGAVSGKLGASGGIAGVIRFGDISNCCNKADITGQMQVGGIVGATESYIYSEVGDIYVYNCFNAGIVQGESEVGGIVGYAQYVICSNVYNTGSIQGDLNVGGIIGKTEKTELNYAYNLCSLSSSAGVIIGNSDHIWSDLSTVTNCYYAKDAGVNESLYAFGNRSEDGSVAGDEVNVAEAKTLAQLQQQATFVNWDFTEIWAIDPAVNGGYPYLSWQSFDDSPVAVNGVTLDKTAVSLAAGDYAYLSASVSPATATDKTIKWTTNAPAVATVSAAGKVEALSAGTATVTATSADGKHSASCTVTVSARAANEYELKKLTLRDSSGDLLSAIPKTSFWATVAIRNLASTGNSMVLLAAYDANDRYLGMNAAWVEDVPVGSTVNVSFLLSNDGGRIAKIKAFCVASFSDPVPLGSSLSITQ